jgi:hypothetical protein
VHQAIALLAIEERLPALAAKMRQGSGSLPDQSTLELKASDRNSLQLLLTQRYVAESPS